MNRGEAERRVEAYLTRHAENDLEGVLSLFVENAVVEDPVGNPKYIGMDAIREFYSATHRSNGPMSIERVGPMLVGGDEVVLHVRAELAKPGSPPAMDVIYVIRLGPGDLIASLRAWY